MTINLDIRQEQIEKRDWMGLVDAVSAKYGTIASSQIGVYEVSDNMDQAVRDEVKQAFRWGIERGYREPSEQYSDAAEFRNLPATVKLPLNTDNLHTCWQNVAYSTAILRAYDTKGCRYHYYYNPRLDFVRNDKPIDPLHDFQSLLTIHPSPVDENEPITFCEADRIPSGTIIEDVCAVLSNGIYLTLVLDSYYVHDRRTFGKYHTDLRTLIYGYDKETSCFMALGFHGAKDTFCTHTLTFADVAMAYERNKIGDWTGNPFAMFYHVHPERLNKGLDPQRLQQALLEYYSDPGTPYIGNNPFGILLECYNGIAIYPMLIELLHWHSEGRSIFPYQNIHAFCDHKEMFMERIEVAAKVLPELVTVEMVEDYRKVAELANNIKALVQKAIIKECGGFARYVPRKTIDRILPCFKECMELEFKYIECLKAE